MNATSSLPASGTPPAASPSAGPPTTLVRAFEIWTPDRDGYLLEWRDGFYPGAAEFDAVSRALVFGRGEGLPGRVWDQGRPILLPSLDGPSFRRGKAARNAGYAAAVGLRFASGGRLRAVAVLFLSADAGTRGAVSIRRRDGDGATTVDATASGLGSGIATIDDQPGFAAVAAIDAAGSGDGWRRAMRVAGGLTFPSASEYVVALALPDVPLFSAIDTWRLDATTQSPVREPAEPTFGAAGSDAANDADDRPDVEEATRSEAWATAEPRIAHAGPGGATLAMPVVLADAVVQLVTMTIG